MKHFDTIIENLIGRHKDPNTAYGSDQIFASANDLSFAISRLLDAQSALKGETLDHNIFTPELLTPWLNIIDDMPAQTANEIAFCIIKNTPLSGTNEEIKTLKETFYHALLNFTENEALSHAFTELFFGEKEVKMPRMKDRD